MTSAAGVRYGVGKLGSSAFDRCAVQVLSMLSLVSGQQVCYLDASQPMVASWNRTLYSREATAAQESAYYYGDYFVYNVEVVRAT